MIRFFAAVLLLAAAASPARAADPKYSAAYDKCLAAPSGQSTAGMID